MKYNKIKKIFIISFLSLVSLLNILFVINTAIKSISAVEPDFERRWVTAQYFKGRLNPYKISFLTLKKVYGTKTYNTLQVVSIPQNVISHPKIKYTNRDPEAVYPPTNMLLFSFSFGLLPKTFGLKLWSIINISLLFVNTYLVYKIFSKKINSKYHYYFIFLTFIIFSGWFATRLTILRSQFGLILITFLLLAFYYMKRKWLLSAIFFSLTMIKPTLMIPFLLVPFVKKKWKIILFVIISQGFLLLLTSLLLKTLPWDLVIQWLKTGSYFGESDLNINEIFNRLNIISYTKRYFIMILSFFITTIILWLNKSDNIFKLISFVSVVSVFWTYRQLYDLIFLIFPLIFFIASCFQNKKFIFSIKNILFISSYLIFSITFLDNVVFTFPNLVWYWLWNFSWLAFFCIGLISLLNLKKINILFKNLNIKNK